MDIDRLHAVLAGTVEGRGVGKTYAACQLLIGYAELELKICVCEVTHKNDIHEVLKVLEILAGERSLGMQQPDSDTVILGCMVARFLSTPQFKEATTGYTGMVLDMTRRGKSGRACYTEEVNNVFDS